MSNADLVTLRDLDRARMFPQELPDGKTPARREHCPQCGHPTGNVVITTGGPYADAATWEAYPVAIDGWRCGSCEALGFPVNLSPEEITQLCNSAVAAAQAGRLDEGELALRRAIASWPGYSPPRVNLGALYLDRIRTERAGANRPEAIRRLAAECEHQLRRARACEPAAPPEAALMLARLLAGTGRADEGRALFTEVSTAPDASPAMRGDAIKRLAELGGPTTMPTSTPAPTSAPMPAPTRRSRVKPVHIAALVVGGPALLLSRGVATTDMFAYAFPIISALLVAWFLSRLVPWWCAAILPVVVGILAVKNVRDIEERQRTVHDAASLRRAIGDVCDGKPLDRESTGPRVNHFETRDKQWRDLDTADGHVPAYVMCTRRHSEEVSCGDFTDQARPDRHRRICTTREHATVELRRTKTAEVVKMRSYRGGPPPALAGYVQYGGAGDTRLSGTPVSDAQIDADFKEDIAR